MTAILDKVKNFLLSPESFVLFRENDFFRENYINPSYAEALPMTEAYYHPLNPCFLFELSGPAIMKLSSIVSVRDGYLSFMDFLVNNHLSLPRWETLFIVPKEFEKLIPDHLFPYFLGYRFSQSQQLKTKHKFIFAYLTEDYLGTNIDEALAKIKLAPDDKVTLYLPQETNLEKVSFNNIFAQKFIFALSEKLQGHQIHHMNTHEFFNTSDFSGYQLLDLAQDQSKVYDNFVHFLMASRGCQSIYPEKGEEEALLTLDISMFHQMNLFPIETRNDYFSELLLYRKHHPQKKLLEDNYFSMSLKNFMNTGPYKA